MSLRIVCHDIVAGVSVKLSAVAADGRIHQYTVRTEGPSKLSIESTTGLNERSVFAADLARAGITAFDFVALSEALNSPGD